MGKKLNHIASETFEWIRTDTHSCKSTLACHWPLACLDMDKLLWSSAQVRQTSFLIFASCLLFIFICLVTRHFCAAIRPGAQKFVHNSTHADRSCSLQNKQTMLKKDFGPNSKKHVFRSGQILRTCSKIAKEVRFGTSESCRFSPHFTEPPRSEKILSDWLKVKWWLSHFVLFLHVFGVRVMLSWIEQTVIFEM